MDINFLLKLSELKKQEISSLKNDFSTLNSIVQKFEEELQVKINFVKEFIMEYTNNSTHNNNVVNILDGRAFLQKLSIQNKELENLKHEAELQKEAAFESLKESAIELKKLNKIIQKQRQFDSVVINSKELLISDTLEMYRYNKKDI